MYTIHASRVGLMPPGVGIEPGTPNVPMTANMILPGGEEFAGGVNWAKFGEDMLRTGIKDTSKLIGGALSRAGRSKVTSAPARPVVPAPLPPSGPALPVYAPPPAKKGLPTWAWALIAVGGVAVVGGVIYFVFGGKKKEG